MEIRDAAACVLRDKAQGVSLPVALEALLTGERVDVEFFASTRPFDGRIEIVEGIPTIFVNSRGRPLDDGRTRFTFAHEIGHYYLHSHLLRRGVVFDDQRINLEAEQSAGSEWEANVFASELLLPTLVLERESRGRVLSLRIVRDLASRAQASLQATAIRLVGESTDRCSVLLVKEGLVAWTAASDDWRHVAFPVRTLVGRALPSNSVSARRTDDFEDEKVSLSSWAPKLAFRDVPLYESAISTSFGRLVFLGAEDYDV